MTKNVSGEAIVALPMPSLLAHGFRPFFLLAGCWAVLGVGLWVAALAGLGLPDGPLPLPRWHAHEMLAGFVGAAVIGFLLTAVPNWTGRRGHSGAPLALLAGAFLLARLVLLPGSPVPPAVAAPLALLPIPLALAMVAPSLLKAGKARLWGPPLLVLGLWAGDLLMLGEAAGWWADGWARGQLLLADMALLLVGLIGGRIIPSFTLNALRRTPRPAEPQPIPGVDAGALAALALVVATDLLAPGTPLAGGAALLAAVLVALRLSRWHGLRVLGQPILWVLHLAYAFVPLALLAKAAFLLLDAAWAAHWLHLQGAGALALMILAVMSRATLGHTGRALVAAPATVAAYVLLALAAPLRAFGPALLPGLTPLALAGACWVAAFALFLAVHAPMLLGPRVDGRPG